MSETTQPTQHQASDEFEGIQRVVEGVKAAGRQKRNASAFARDLPSLCDRHFHGAA